MARTSPRAAPKPRRTASPFPLPFCLRKRRGLSGFFSMAVRIAVSVPSFEPPSTKMYSLFGGRVGSRATMGAMWPSSLRQGMTTLTEGSDFMDPAWRPIRGRAIIPNIRERASNPGRWPIQRFSSSERRGM